MGLWNIIQPWETVNLISNPSLEKNTTGWSAAAGSIARSTDEQRFGLYSLRWTPAAGAFDAVSFGDAVLADGFTYTFSLYVKGAVGVVYRLYIGSTGGSVIGTPTSFVGTGQWQRVIVILPNAAPATRRLYLSKDNDTDQQDVYIDGAQLEEVDGQLPGVFIGATTYCDGDQPGCKWRGLAQASRSERSGQSGAGGILRNLDEFHVFVQETNGAGMPGLTNVATTFSMADGGLFQRTIAKPRVFTLMLSGYNEANNSLIGLHQLRQEVINVIKPDRLGQQQPFILEYSGGERPIRIAAFYDGGLEWDNHKGFSQTIGLRCIAYDPYWFSEFDSGQTLQTSTTLSSPNYALLKVDGAWRKLGTGLNDTALTAYQTPDGTLYVGGNFTTAGGTTVNRIARWNGSAWVALGSGCNGTVWSIIGDGTDSGIYVAGAFTTAGGTTVNRIARWDGSAWTALGSGCNGTVLEMLLHPNGLLYVCGEFTTAGGVSASFVAAWNGSSWAALGSGLIGGGGSQARALALGGDGKVYVSGTFTTPFMYNAAWNPITQVWNAVPNGPFAPASGLAVRNDGTLLNAGSFTDPISGAALEGAQWNGAAWRRLEPPSTDIIRRIKLLDDVAYMAGPIEKFGGTQPFQLWNGSYFIPLDLSIPSTDGVILQPLLDGSLFAGFTSSPTAYGAAQTTVINNGTSAAWPRISITGPGSVICIINQTTGQALYFTNLTLQTNEVLHIDLRLGVKTFLSNMRNCMPYLSPVSDTSTFNLLPGENTLSILAPGCTASLIWQERHWSIDGGAA
jgi:hypothetical protein